MSSDNYPTRLVENEVHIWRAWLPEWDSSRVTTLLEFLSPEEHLKTQRYIFERDKKRSAVSRGLLRVLLGRYLQQPPEALAFSYNEYGKPVLTADFANSSLTFNVSHSENALVYALAQQQPIGLDVEEIRELPDLAQLAGSFLTAAEAAFLQNLAPAQRPTEFFNLWTAKEAYLKATGQGLSGSLAEVEFAKVNVILGLAAPRWTVCSLANPYPNYKAALVTAEDCPTRGWFSLNPELVSC